jgi:hypothetical protein
MKYLYEAGINAYIPDNKFRNHDPKFAAQKDKYGKRYQKPKKDRVTKVIPTSGFKFDPMNSICICHAGEKISHIGCGEDQSGVLKAYFSGRLLQYRNCELKTKCMQNLVSANHRKGSGRQVSFANESKRKRTHTDWIKHRVYS